MSTEQNKIINRRFYEEVINQQHVETVEQFLGAAYVSHAFPPGLPQGPQGFRMFIGAFHAGFPDGRVHIEEMVAEGDTVVTRLTFTGTQTGEFMGIPPTGNSIAVPAIDLAHFSEGKLVEHWGGPDQMALMQQLGAVSIPG